MPSIESSNLQVPAELAEAGTHIRKISGDLAAELAALQAQLAPLEESWTGSTYQHFKGLEQEWNMAAAGLWGDGGAGSVGLLPFIARALDISYQNYTNAEQANTKTWQV
ncbi:WXG100 family type VII secretion target [Micromonospora sp. CA-111912]|uniref:WXG100 family type VII secretion target n=1 Tax=Micromonospora sp. CA-111912 TaxID=3239955 RepID=UPI003D9089CE